MYNTTQKEAHPDPKSPQQIGQPPALSASAKIGTFKLSPPSPCHGQTNMFPVVGEAGEIKHIYGSGRDKLPVQKVTAGGDNAS